MFGKGKAVLLQIYLHFCTFDMWKDTVSLSIRWCIQMEKGIKVKSWVTCGTDAASQGESVRQHHSYNNADL